MKLDLDDIERKAKSATPGNWTATKAVDDEGWMTVAVVAAVAAVAPRQLVYTDHRGGVAPEANRQFIAAASPLVVLALIAEIRRLEVRAKAADVLEVEMAKLLPLADAAERFVDEQGKRVLDRELMGTADFEGDLFAELVAALEAAGR